MCLSVGITFVARKYVAKCQMEKNVYDLHLRRYVCKHACLHICIWVCVLAAFPILCVCAGACVWKRDDGSDGGDSARRHQPPHCGGVNTRPDTCFSQNELWNKAKRALFSTQLTTEAEAKDLGRDRMRLALQRVLNSKISRVRRHEGYESLFTLIDSLIMENGILIDFCIACFALWLMQLN